MNDRLKFRAYITCNICNDVEEEKEVSFYIYDVAVYSDGMIGFSRDSLLDVLSKLDLTENQKDEIEEHLSENSYCEDYEWVSIEFGKVEQCTELKDKNGKLIYEGDIVITYYNGEPTGQMYIYHWEAPAFYVEPFEKGKPSGRHYYYFAVENERCEVIGNIRENPDLLKNLENFNVSAENVKGYNR